jgi:hypothetical protein
MIRAVDKISSSALMAKLVRRHTSNVAILSSNLSESNLFFCSVKK